MQESPPQATTAPAALACPNCAAPVEEGQLACLNCGTRLAVRRGRPNWRLTLLGVALAVLLGGAVLGYVLGTLQRDQTAAVGESSTLGASSTASPTAPSGQAPTTGGGASPPPGEGSAEGETLPEATGGSQEPGAAAGGTTADPAAPEGTGSTAPSGTTPTSTGPNDTGSGSGTAGTGSAGTDSGTDSGTSDGSGTAAGAGRGERLTWSAGAERFTVVLVSAGSESGAEGEARRARGAGLDAGVLRSSDYGSLRPGYWVAFAGRFSSRSAAARAAGRYRGQGFPEAYPREVRR